MKNDVNKKLLANYKKWKGKYTLNDFYPKLLPDKCKHCQIIMSHGGRIPDNKDLDSWYHWRHIQSAPDGIKKTHKTQGALGAICIECYTNRGTQNG